MMAPDNDTGSPDDPTEAVLVPAIHCTDGATLRRVRLLSPAQWEALPESQRPDRAEHIPGFGWVVGFPEQILN
jgi:hypothetical protein